jgi:hypothetical protein
MDWFRQLLGGVEIKIGVAKMVGARTVSGGKISANRQVDKNFLLTVVRHEVYSPKFDTSVYNYTLILCSCLLLYFIWSA